MVSVTRDMLGSIGLRRGLNAEERNPQVLASAWHCEGGDLGPASVRLRVRVSAPINSTAFIAIINTGVQALLLTVFFGQTIYFKISRVFQFLPMLNSPNSIILEEKTR